MKICVPRTLLAFLPVSINFVAYSFGSVFLCNQICPMGNFLYYITSVTVTPCCFLFEFFSLLNFPDIQIAVKVATYKLVSMTINCLIYYKISLKSVLASENGFNSRQPCALGKQFEKHLLPSSYKSKSKTLNYFWITFNLSVNANDLNSTFSANKMYVSYFVTISISCK